MPVNLFDVSVPGAVTLHAVSVPASAALRVGESGGFDPEAFDLFSYDTENSQDVSPTVAILHPV